MWYRHTQGNSGQHKREGKLAIWDNLDGPGGHCAKRHKSERGTKTQYDLIKCGNKKQTEFIATENMGVVTRGGGLGKMGTNFQLQHR